MVGIVNHDALFQLRKFANTRYSSTYVYLNAKPWNNLFYNFNFDLLHPMAIELTTEKLFCRCVASTEVELWCRGRARLLIVLT